MQGKLSATSSNQAGQIVLTAGQFSSPVPGPFNETPGSSRSPEQSSEYLTISDCDIWGMLQAEK